MSEGPIIRFPVLEINILNRLSEVLFVFPKKMARWQLSQGYYQY